MDRHKRTVPSRPRKNPSHIRDAYERALAHLVDRNPDGCVVLPNGRKVAIAELARVLHALEEARRRKRDDRIARARAWGEDYARAAVERKFNR
jgi:hypothetical protein